jgi:hypothetical protein
MKFEQFTAKLMLRIIIAACALVAIPAQSQVWNLADDFSINSNPNGQWRYGSTVTVGGAFEIFTRTAQIPYQVSHGAVAEWVGTYFSGFELFPYVTKFYGDPGTTVSVTNACNAVSCSIANPGIIIIQRSANGVGVHPAPPGQGYAALRWTAPKSTSYVISVSFFSIVVGGVATTDVHVLRNDVSVFNGEVNGVSPAQNWSTGSPGIALNAGDVIDLVVGPNGDNFGDSTGVDATIQVLPEVLSCLPYNENYYKTVKPSNSVSSNVSPNISGQPSICAIPSSKPASWYIKTTWDGGVTWQWVDTLSSLGLGAN